MIKNRIMTRKVVVINKPEGFRISEWSAPNVNDIVVDEVSGSLTSVLVSSMEKTVSLVIEDGFERYTMRFGLTHKRLYYILSCLTDRWALRHLDDVVIRTSHFNGGMNLSVISGGKKIELKQRKDGTMDGEEEFTQEVLNMVSVLDRTLKLPYVEDVVPFKEKYGFDYYDWQNDAESDFAGKSHFTSLPFLRYRTGRNLMCAIAKTVVPNPPAAMCYRCYNELDIGGLYVDAAIELLDFSYGLRAKICLELKVSIANLREDRKFAESYLESGMFDFYYLVGSTRKVAEAAVQQYNSNPCIGVGCLESGEVLKVPGVVATNARSVSRYLAEVNGRRNKLKDGVKDSKYFHYRDDDEIMFLMMNEQEQTIPYFKLQND